MAIDTGGSAFPYVPHIAEGHSGRFAMDNGIEEGMTLLDYFAAHAPEPTKEAITAQAELDRAANPHGYDHMPARRSWERIVADLKYRCAIGMMEARAALETR